MDLNDEEKMDSQKKDKTKFATQLDLCCHEQILDRFNKANLFITCCVIAALLLITYLAAFSCEVSWLLEARGNLPTAAYLLCAGYFIMFVASTVLIHGLVTGLPWGLFSWSAIIGILSIPELAFVMIMTTQYWGLQSTHGLTELVGYAIRLIINCIALLCVIPTALKWRREARVLTQLQTLASRLQLQTPPPSVPLNKTDSARGSKKRRRSRRSSGFDNHGFIINEHGMPAMLPFYGNFDAQNEFNASIFGLNPNQYIGPNVPHNVKGKRTQSLMDLRFVLPRQLRGYSTRPDGDEPDGKYFVHRIENTKKPIDPKKNIEDLSAIETLSEPLYYTIEPTNNSKLSRNCVSLENLGGITKTQTDLNYGNNLLQNYQYCPIIGYPYHQNQYPIHFLNYQIPGYGSGGVGYGGFTNPYADRSNTNSKQSLGNDSDDYRKYRDVAL